LFLALCSQGAPFTVIAELTGKDGPPSFWRTERGFDGRVWVSLPPILRQRAIDMLTPAERCRFHGLLFRAWPKTGWDYLRRAVHAWESNDPELITAQAVPVAYGVANLGPEFARRHFLAVAKAFDCLGVDGNTRGKLWGKVAQLAGEQKSGTPNRSALVFFHKALRNSTDPADKIEWIYEVANFHARLRLPKSLRCARSYYKRGFTVLPQLVDEEQRMRKEIRLLNGLALVAYHERNSDEALRLEELAHAIADRASERFTTLAGWAKPLLNTNIAKLLIQRFNDPSAAARYLRTDVDSPNERIRRKATLDLARISFDRGDSEDTVNLLSHLYDNTLADENEADEALGRSLYAIAALRVGRTEQAAKAIERLEYLSNALDLPGGQEIVAAVRKCLLTSLPRTGDDS
jgi:hypothetical protein